ncbi:phage major capsid protein [Eggerthella lenta]|uniref:phage major capsid protein n=1 Tax=Eggerthella lenta TaxID=84112 RepID=UPI0022E0C305|nr:phage major capsid protein [Eggerthella lenta]
MPGYNNIQGRADLTDVLLPDQVIKEVIQEAPKTSVIMSRAKNVRLSAKKAKQPVLATLPEAYWVDGDTGMKQTTKSSWKNINITAEELAVIVPIPDALIDDADVPLWDAIRPLLNEAIGKKVDDAALFGVDKPDSWPQAVIPAAIAAGNTVARGTGSDLGVDVANLGAMLAKQGFGVNGFAAKPGMQWELVGLRNANGDPIYTQSLAGSPVSGLYGYPLNEVTTGVWDASKAELLAGDWNKFVVGIRQDITYDLFKEGVISDDDGKVILNLMQQDCKAMRVVFRVGFQVAVPVTRLGGKYPAGVIVPAQVAAKALDDMTVAELTAYAADHGIDLGSATLKADILAAIKAAEAGA